MEKIDSSLSTKRVLISLFLFACIPLGARILNLFLDQYDISLMVSMNIFGSSLIFYDWNLFGLHYNRAKYNLDDTLLYCVIAYVILLIWTIFAIDNLHCRIIVPSSDKLTKYGYARIGMLIAYSFMESTSVSIAVKCATDRLKISHNELQIILFTGLSAGLALTLLFIPSLNPLTMLTTLLYNVIVMIFLSYFYNQTGSFIPGAMGFALVNLTIMILPFIS